MASRSKYTISHDRDCTSCGRPRTEPPQGGKSVLEFCLAKTEHVTPDGQVWVRNARTGEFSLQEAL